MQARNEATNFDLIDLTPVEQTGHNCKVTALGSLDQYWATQVGFKPLPVHKNSRGIYRSPLKQKISLRQIAKRYGSRQGELLEIAQLEQISAAIGYQTKTVHCDTLEVFKKTVQENVKEKKPMICFFSVARNTGQPIFEAFNHDDPLEHACIITGYKEETDEVRISHAGRHFFCSLQDLYRSMQTLPDERRTEYYKSLKPSNFFRKYDLVQSGARIGKKGRVSITPAENSGFKNKLVILEKPELQQMQTLRESFVTAPVDLHKKRTVLRRKQEAAAVESGTLEEGRKKRRKGKVTHSNASVIREQALIEQPVEEAFLSTLPPFEQVLPLEIQNLAMQQVLWQQILLRHLLLQQLTGIGGLLSPLFSVNNQFLGVNPFSALNPANQAVFTGELQQEESKQPLQPSLSAENAFLFNNFFNNNHPEATKNKPAEAPFNTFHSPLEEAGDDGIFLLSPENLSNSLTGFAETSLYQPKESTSPKPKQ